jgi:CheY-like chemotaxis protein
MNPPRSSPFTILVIGDDRLVLSTASDLLTAEGHRVLTASSWEEGLGMARTIRTDLVLVDYSMPVRNGLEVVQRLKADTETRRIPVVALTSGTAEDANELSRAGCVAFIPKPFEPRNFVRLVADILKETVGRRDARD